MRQLLPWLGRCRWLEGLLETEMIQHDLGVGVAPGQFVELGQPVARQGMAGPRVAISAADPGIEGIARDAVEGVGQAAEVGDFAGGFGGGFGDVGALALGKLGYTQPEAEKAVRKAVEKAKGAATPELVRAGLAELQRR